MTDESTNLIVQALHAIRDEQRKTNDRLDTAILRLESLEKRVGGVEERIGGVDERIDALRIFTVKGLTELNTKMDRLAVVTEKHNAEIHELNTRFDHFLRGEGAKIGKRVAKLETQVSALMKRKR